MDEDSFLKRLLTLHLIHKVVIPIFLPLLTLLGIMFVIGSSFIYSDWNLYNNNKVIDLFNQDNFSRIIFHEKIEVDLTYSERQNETEIQYQNIVIFDAPDASKKARLWLKNNQYASWDENWDILRQTKVPQQNEYIYDARVGTDWSRPLDNIKKINNRKVITVTINPIFLFANKNTKYVYMWEEIHSDKEPTYDEEIKELSESKAEDLHFPGTRRESPRIGDLDLL